MSVHPEIISLLFPLNSDDAAFLGERYGIPADVRYEGDVSRPAEHTINVQNTFPAANQPAIPQNGQNAFPAANQPALPQNGQNAFPAVNQPSIPQNGQNAFPAANQPAFPQNGQNAFPAANQPSIPQNGQNAFPAANQYEKPEASTDIKKKSKMGAVIAVVGAAAVIAIFAAVLLMNMGKGKVENTDVRSSSDGVVSSVSETASNASASPAQTSSESVSSGSAPDDGISLESNNKESNSGDGSSLSSKNDEELNKLLNESRQDALEGIGNRLDKDNYETAQQKEIETIIEKYTKKIEEATDSAQVNEIYTEATDELDKVRTKEQTASPTYVEEGTHGVLSWRIDNKGVLTISGKGEMEDSELSYPWTGCSFKTVVIESGVTSVGKNAFRSSPVTGITIPSTVRSIGKGAFMECSSLESVKITGGLKSIGEYAFQSCGRLSELTLPEGLESIGGSAFAGCTSLKELTIPKSVSEIGYGAFSLWTSSQTITVKGYSSAPSGWNKYWNISGSAKYVWGA